jgi:hypothetical protein
MDDGHFSSYIIYKMGENKTTLGIYAPIDEGKEGPKKERDEAIGFSQTQTQKTNNYYF